MQWVQEYQLFLFDFDGLLVNTEEIHFMAYQKMCSDRGFYLPWDYEQYCLAAHYDQETLRTKIFAAVPLLPLQEKNWDLLYAEKKQALEELLTDGAVHLMPGAARLLKCLHEAGINHCVVTNSTKPQIDIIRKKIPELLTIPHWFTRETYTHAKPDPECYLNAIRMVGEGAKNIIGFEDTPRGLRALLQTPVKSVLISAVHYPEVAEFESRGVSHFSSLTDLADNRP